MPHWGLRSWPLRHNNQTARECESNKMVPSSATFCLYFRHNFATKNHGRILFTFTSKSTRYTIHSESALLGLVNIRSKSIPGLDSCSQIFKKIASKIWYRDSNSRLLGSSVSKEPKLVQSWYECVVGLRRSLPSFVIYYCRVFIRDWPSMFAFYTSKFYF